MNTGLKVAVIAAVVVIAVIASIVSRRRTGAPVRAAYTVPTGIDRKWFASVVPSADDAVPWWVIVLSSPTCETCTAVVARAEVLASNEVCVSVVGHDEYPQVHRALGIDAVPLTLLVDHTGEVLQHFAGPVTSSHLWGGLAALRDPSAAGGVCDGAHAH